MSVVTSPDVHPTGLDFEVRKEIAELFHMLGDPTRLGIVYACLTEPRAAGDIADALGISASLASHHLRLLRQARLVRAERRGQQVFYVAQDAHVQHILSDMAVHAREKSEQRSR